MQGPLVSSSSMPVIIRGRIHLEKRSRSPPSHCITVIKEKTSRPRKQGQIKGNTTGRKQKNVLIKNRNKVISFFCYSEQKDLETSGHLMQLLLNVPGKRAGRLKYWGKRAAGVKV